MPRMIRLILLMTLSAVGVPVHAASLNVSLKHQTWQSAPKISLAEPATIYGMLRGLGDTRLVSLPVTAGQDLAFTVSVLPGSAAGFKPRLVVIVPDTVTAGPVLPFEVPPEHIALAFGDDKPSTHTDRRTQIQYIQHTEVTQAITKPGTAYVAVYDAGQQSGSFRLTVASSSASSERFWSWPADWLRAQNWAGIHWLGGIVPLAILVLIILGIAFRRMRTKKSIKRK